MKEILILPVLVFVIISSSFSQPTERIYIQSGSKAWDNFVQAIYLYSSFKEGMVEFKNGQRFIRPMNYNRIAATVEFINDKNDTLAFADEASVGHINIGGDVFIFNPVCLRLLSSKKVKLYVYEKMKFGDKQKIGAMGVPNSGSAIESVEKIDTYQRSYNIDVNETVILSKSSSFFIQTATSEIIPASKKNVLSLLPDKESAVKEYIKSKNISFNKASDLMEMVKFLDEL